MTEKKQNRPLNIAGAFSGLQHTCVASLDWLQIDSRGGLKNSEYFITLDTEKKTAVFNKLYQIYDGTNYVASIVSEPILEELPEDLNLVKLINKELYYSNPVSRIIAISIDHKLKPLRPSRIDICIDFHTFLGGYKPETLIKDLFNRKYIKRGIQKYCIFGDFADNKNTPHEIKFSKKRSNVDTYLYNKTKEMRDKKFKPWIVERWQLAGFDMSKEVWRLEFSIHNPHFMYTNKDTGETRQFDYTKLDDDNYVHEILRVLIAKYFDIRINTKIKNNADMPRIKLFKGIKNVAINFIRPDTIESDRADWNFVKRLKELNNEVRTIDLKLGMTADELVRYYKKSRKL